MENSQKMQDRKPTGQGGWRPGSGRKPGVRKPDIFIRKQVPFRLPGWLIQKIQKEYPRRGGKFVEGTILEATGWKKPVLKSGKKGKK